MQRSTRSSGQWTVLRKLQKANDTVLLNRWISSLMSLLGWFALASTSLLTPNASVAQKHFPARRLVNAQTEISSLLPRTIPLRGILVPALLSTAFLLQLLLTICLTNGQYACFVEVDDARTRWGSQAVVFCRPPAPVLPQQFLVRLGFAHVAVCVTSTIPCPPGIYTRGCPDSLTAEDQSNIPQTMDFLRLCIDTVKTSRHERADKPANGKEDPLSAQWMTNDKVLSKRTPAMCR